MKISISTKLRELDDELEASVEWLHQYMLSSFNMDPKYLAPSRVMRILRPLYKLVPRPEISKPLYRVQEFKKDLVLGSEFELKKSNKVVSWTESSKLKDWKQIADDVGILGEPRVYVLKALDSIPLFTTPKFQKSLAAKLKKYDHDNYKIDEYIEWDKDWQSEVIADGSTPVKVQVIRLIEDS